METLKNAAGKVVGTKQVLRAIKNGELKTAYVANDADTFLFQRIIRAAEDAGVKVERVPTMRALGQACGVEVATATAGLLK